MFQRKNKIEKFLFSLRKYSDIMLQLQKKKKQNILFFSIIFTQVEYFFAYIFFVFLFFFVFPLLSNANFFLIYWKLKCQKFSNTFSKTIYFVLRENLFFYSHCFSAPEERNKQTNKQRSKYHLLKVFYCTINQVSRDTGENKILSIYLPLLLCKS